MLYRQGITPEDATPLAHHVWTLAEQTRWLSPFTPAGKPFSVAQVNFGALGWISDAQGYRYVPYHPLTNRPWPPIPPQLLALWKDHIGEPVVECCLVNHYTPAARMGLHRDADEEDQNTPLLSISLGQPARFRLGGVKRSDPTRSVILEHGDILILSGQARRAHHGIDRLLPPDLMVPTDLPFEGRLNITLRRVTASQTGKDAA